MRFIILLILSLAPLGAQQGGTPAASIHKACVGTPGNTTGAYRQQCQTSAGALYACNNSTGCATSGQWVAQGGGSSGNTTTTGIFAALPGSSSTAGNTYRTTDTPYSFVWNGSAWLCFWSNIPCTLPSMTGWTFSNGGSSTAEITNGSMYLVFTPAASAVAMRAYCHTAPDSAFVSTALLRMDLSGAAAGAAGDIAAGLGFSDGTKYFVSAIGVTSSAYQVGTMKWNTATSFSADSIRNAGASASTIANSSLLWLQVEWDGDQIVYRYSLDGSRFTIIDARNQSGFLSGISNVCFAAYTNSTTARLTVMSYSEITQ